MVAGNLYSEFVVLFRLAHRTRLPKGTADAHESWLERYYQQGIAEGGRVRERLSEGVHQALLTLGSGFLAHPGSAKLRDAFGTTASTRPSTTASCFAWSTGSCS